MTTIGARSTQLHPADCLSRADPDNPRPACTQKIRHPEFSAATTSVLGRRGAINVPSDSVMRHLAGTTRSIAECGHVVHADLESDRFDSLRTAWKSLVEYPQPQSAR